MVSGAACRSPASHDDAPGPLASAAPSVAPSAASPPPPPAASAYRVRPVTDGRTVEVRLVYAGKPRPPWKVPAAFASHCGGAAEVPDPSVEVDAKGGVTGAVAWIDDLHEGEPLVPADVVLDQKSCTFAPHVLAMAAGAKLGLTNRDPANHAMRLDFLGGPEDESVVKMVPPGNADAIATQGAWAGRVGRVTCPIHPWMLGWVHFFDHPYFAVTRGGVARIPGSLRARGTSRSGTRPSTRR